MDFHACRNRKPEADIYIGISHRKKKHNIEHHSRTVESLICQYETAEAASLELPRGAIHIGHEVAPEASLLPR